MHAVGFDLRRKTSTKAYREVEKGRTLYDSGSTVMVGVMWLSFMSFLPMLRQLRTAFGFFFSP